MHDPSQVFHWPDSVICERRSKSPCTANSNHTILQSKALRSRQASQVDHVGIVGFYPRHKYKPPAYGRFATRGTSAEPVSQVQTRALHEVLIAQWIRSVLPFAPQADDPSAWRTSDAIDPHRWILPSSTRRNTRGSHA